MNALISLLFQRKKKPKDRSVTSALINDGIVGMINLAAPPTQDKLKATKDKQEKQVEEAKEEKKKKKIQVEEAKEEKKKKIQVEEVKEEKRVKQEKKKEKQAEEAKEEKRVKQEKKKEKQLEEVTLEKWVKQDKKKEEKRVKQKEKQEKQVEEVKEEKKQDKEETPATVRKRNKRHLKVTIAPGTMTSESAEEALLYQFIFQKHFGGLRAAMSVSRPRLRERSASEESPSELSTSPFPGDTLPWNLAKHQRVKRSKSASGDVLDPAERAVIRIAGKRWSGL
ncbi:hypothetical protein SRHO_G00014500 [Serrasalmus rhombeus]